MHKNLKEKKESKNPLKTNQQTQNVKNSRERSLSSNPAAGTSRNSLSGVCFSLSPSVSLCRLSLSLSLLSLASTSWLTANCIQYCNKSNFLEGKIRIHQNYVGNNKSTKIKNTNTTDNNNNNSISALQNYYFSRVCKKWVHL